jgi:hypothetical protein
MSIEAMKQALEALDRNWDGCVNSPEGEAITALNAAIEAAKKQEPVACRTLCELCIKRGYNFCANAAKTTPITTPAKAQPCPYIRSTAEGTHHCALANQTKEQS